MLERKIVLRKQELRTLSMFELRQHAKRLGIYGHKDREKAFLVDAIVDVEMFVNFRKEPANVCHTCGRVSTIKFDNETWACLDCGEYAIEPKEGT